jgi:orotidine-5'-phosphate decarboxylase
VAGVTAATSGAPHPIVALDVPGFEQAVGVVDTLGDACDFYKVGLELFAADGPEAVEWLRAEGKSVFVDLKAHDIPNTVRGLARSAAGMGANLLTVHGAGGEAMVRAAVEGAGAQDGTGCGILVVTVLTSFDAASYSDATGRDAVDLQAEVGRLAGVAQRAGAHGVVCSGLEAARVRSAFAGLRTLVPGVRLEGGAPHDQSRVVTPAQARSAGASYVVVGRAVTQAPDPAAAMHELLRELGREG